MSGSECCFQLMESLKSKINTHDLRNVLLTADIIDLLCMLQFNNCYLPVCQVTIHNIFPNVLRLYQCTYNTSDHAMSCTFKGPGPVANGLTCINMRRWSFSSFLIGAEYNRVLKWHHTQKTYGLWFGERGDCTQKTVCEHTVVPIWTFFFLLVYWYMELTYEVCTNISDTPCN